MVLRQKYRKAYMYTTIKEMFLFPLKELQNWSGVEYTLSLGGIDDV